MATTGWYAGKWEGNTVSHATVLRNFTNTQSSSIEKFSQMIDNYIYLYHVSNQSGKEGTVIVLPSYADSVTDTLAVNYNTETPLARSAPIYSYQSSGPRTVQVSFSLHRDMMKQINFQTSNASVTLDEDYVDLFIKYIQAAALPAYSTASKMVNPPVVALRLGNDIFIKGVINGSVGITYNYPILSNGKYALVSVSFSITEIDPYDAKTVMTTGSFRGLSTSLERRIWKQTGYSNKNYPEVGNMS